jgi:hypothetical protein
MPTAAVWMAIGATPTRRLGITTAMAALAVRVRVSERLWNMGSVTSIHILPEEPCLARRTQFRKEWRL